MDQRAVWDAEAATFDDEPDHGLGDPVTRVAWRDLLLAVLPPSPARVADVGCGTGTLSVLLAEEGYAVDGIDLSPEMVGRARRKAADTPATFEVGDAADPGLERSSYDVVLSRHVLWTMPDPQAAFRRWCDLLRPGGTAVLVEGNWSTGAGLTAEQCVAIVDAAGRSSVVRPMPEPVFWGKEIDDERYLVVVR